MKYFFHDYLYANNKETIIKFKINTTMLSSLNNLEYNHNPNGKVLMNSVMSELTLRFECDNCGKCKPARHFHDMVCSSICDHQYRDGGFYMSIGK